MPPNPGNLSAFGLLAVDWRTDHMVTKVMHEEAIDLAAVAAIYTALEEEGAATLERDGIAPAQDRARCAKPTCAMPANRWKFACRRLPARSSDQFVARLIEAFHAAHLKTFGYNYAGQQKVELVNFCVSGFGMIDRPSIPVLEETGAAPKPGSRPVYFDGQFRDTPVFARASLRCRLQARRAGRSSRNSARPRSSFPARNLTVDPHGILIIRTGGRPTETRTQ